MCACVCEREKEEACAALLQRAHEGVQVVLGVVLLLVPQLPQALQHGLHGGLARGGRRLVAPLALQTRANVDDEAELNVCLIERRPPDHQNRPS